MPAIRIAAIRILSFGLMLLGALGAASLPAASQTAAQAIGGSLSDPLSQEVLRALQQRGGTQTVDPGVQPNVQIQNPPVYPQSTPAAPAGGRQNPAAVTNGLSGLERLMSLRTGQRLQQFGYDIFGRGNPVVMRQSGALQDNYILGDGDEIVVSLHGQENANYRSRVDRDGRVVLPNLPPISASGRSLGAFRTDLENAVSHAFIGTQASVSVGAVRQIGVRVVGEVNAPGFYSLTGLSTALDAINLANGVKKTGSLRAIQVVRGGRVLRLDLYTLLTNQAAGSDITLTDGDRIVVPLLAGAVAAAGQVRRPGIYELPPGTASMRSSELLALAGGPEVRGAYRFSVMTTGEDGRRQMQPVAAGSDVIVRDGDALFVASSSDSSVARIELMGSTGSQGTFALGAAPTLHALLKSSDMFAPQPGQPLPYLLMAAIVRLDRDTVQRTVIPFSPVEIMSGKNDRPLQSGDVVYILNVAEMRYIASRAAQAAMREAERSGGNTALQQPRTSNLSTGRGDDDSTLSALTLQGGGLAGQPLPNLGLDGSLSTADGRNRVQVPQNVRPQFTELDQAGAPASNVRRSIRGPYGAEDNDDLPELGGIPAPPDITMPDEGGEGGGDLPLDTMARPDREDNRANLPSTRGVPQTDIADRARSVRRSTLRLFVGLDDDERRLLIRTLDNYYVLVSGEVNSPGAFLAMPQAGLDKIVQAAGGVTPNVDLSGFEISSADVDNASGVSRTVRKVYQLKPDQFTQVALKPLDSIRFNKVYSDNAGEAAVYGEVRYPGSYAITRSERLSSVLARAGGLTGAAYTYGAIFLRRSVAEQERGVLQREADALDSQLVGLMSTISANKAQVSDAEIQYVNQMMLRLRQAEGQGGRVAVQIDPREIALHPELDIIMEPGDRLFIPRMPNSVVVAGEVMSPSGIQFKAGRSVADYLALAGGPTEIADEDHIFVVQPDGSAVQADGSSWLGDAPKLAPGSVIVVPRTLHPFSWDLLFSNALQAISQLAVTAASISVISK